MSEIRDTLIREHLGRLWGTLGPQPLPVNELMLRRLYENKDYTEMFGLVKSQMVLSLQLRIGFVNKGGPANTPAWTPLRTELPIYGTEAYKRTLVTIFIRKIFLAQAPFATVVYAMAHELAHILLLSLRNPLYVDEVAADLAVLLCGYGKFYAAGRVYDVPAEREVHKEKKGFDLFADILEPFDDLFGRIDAKKDATSEVAVRTVGYLSANEIHYAEKLIVARRR